MLQLGVRTEASTAGAALAETNERRRARLGTLEVAGIAARDIQTSQLSIWLRYDYSEERPPPLVGYEVSNAVSVTVRPLDALGETLNAVVQAGGNEISGSSFGSLLDQAREGAMSNAHHKAQHLADLAGPELGPVVTRTEAGAAPPPIMTRSMADVAAAAKVPIEVGESTLSVTVEARYELVP